MKVPSSVAINNWYLVLSGTYRCRIGTEHFPKIFSDELNLRVPLEVWVCLNPSRHLRHGTSLIEHKFIAINGYSGSDSWWWSGTHLIVVAFNVTRLFLIHCNVSPRSAVITAVRLWWCRIFVGEPIYHGIISIDVRKRIYS